MLTIGVADWIQFRQNYYYYYYYFKSSLTKFLGTKKLSKLASQESVAFESILKDVAIKFNSGSLSIVSDDFKEEKKVILCVLRSYSQCFPKVDLAEAEVILQEHTMMSNDCIKGIVSILESYDLSKNAVVPIVSIE